MIPLHETVTEQILPSRLAAGAKGVSLSIVDDGPVRALWQRRLEMFVNADQKLLRINRLRKINSAIILAVVLTLVFSLFVTPTISETVFVVMMGTLALTVGMFPVFSVLTREYQNNRDAVSRLFYENNHEIDVTDEAITVFNRVSYLDVARVALADCHLGNSL